MTKCAWQGVLVAAVAFLVGRSVHADAVTYEMVTVGDAGNANDNYGYGGVAYEYHIGKYEVTIGQYTAFLNAVAQSDPYALYDPTLATNLNTAGISRSGSSGNYTYSVIDNGGSSANRPISSTSWFNAARFANWMHNGQGSGSTETGAYTLVSGQTSGTAPSRNPGALFALPTENEWKKAAYYQPESAGGPAGGYWWYPTRSNSLPGNVVGGAPNQVNYYTNDVLAVTQQPWPPSPTQNYLTDVGAFTGSASYYGTFDQGGNAPEWNDVDGTPSTQRGMLGGRWSGYYAFLNRANNTTFYAGNTGGGFRLWSPTSTPVPEIDPAGLGSVLALVTGALGLLERRRSVRA